MEQSVNVYNKIPEFFESMAYGENTEKVQGAIDWLKTKGKSLFSYINDLNEPPSGLPLQLHNAYNNEVLCTVHVPEIDNIKKILGRARNDKWTGMDPLERTKIIHKISTEIEKQSDLFTQLEILTRGILARDTKTKGIPLLAQYFRYYSAFAFSSNDDVSKPKPLGTAVGVISNENYLPHLGLFLAPALAAGCNVILHIGSQLAPVAYLLQDIAKSAGLPEETFKIIPSDDGELSLYLDSDQVDIVTLFVDVNSDKYRGFNTSHKKLLQLTSHKTPVIIFDSADIDAAYESVIESSWGYQSMLPWSTDTILVQENIFEIFLNKLKSKLKSIKVGPANDKSANVAFACKSSLESRNKVVNEAKQQGIEVFQTINDCAQWSPTLLIGGKVGTNVALRSDDDRSKTVTVLAFRSIDEAVNLANNSRQGLWASIWSENVGLVNEVTRKLKVSNVWVNGSYGQTSPEVTISPLKESGIGNFGGKAGYLEYVHLDKHEYSDTKLISHAKYNINVDGIVSAAKKAQESWQRVPKIQKQKIFQEFAEYLQLQANGAVCNDQKWLAFNIKQVYETITNSCRDNIPSTISGYQLSSTREPRGVIVVDTSESLNAQLILTSLFEGNSVIFFHIDSGWQKYYEFLKQKLPSGVLTMVNYDESVLEKLVFNKVVSVHFGNHRIVQCLSLRDSVKYREVSSTREDLYGKINYVKNVWGDIGKSSTCKFS